MTARAAVAAAAVACASVALAAGCGEDDAPTVSAASSLKLAFERYAETTDGPAPRFSFGGSDELAAQLRQGARPDVYAAADTELPRALHAEGLVEAPVTFAANRLVVAVPADSGVRSLADLAEPGVAIAAGAPSVPIGAYTRDLLRRLGGATAAGILANVRSEEPDVAGVVGKVARGAADAGFVYATDVRASGGALRAVELPPRLRPAVAYAAAVVRGGERTAQARAFVAGLTGGAGRRALLDAGFAAP